MTLAWLGVFFGTAVSTTPNSSFLESNCTLLNSGLVACTSYIGSNAAWLDLFEEETEDMPMGGWLGEPCTTVQAELAELDAMLAAYEALRSDVCDVSLIDCDDIQNVATSNGFAVDGDCVEESIAQGEYCDEIDSMIADIIDAIVEANTRLTTCTYL